LFLKLCYGFGIRQQVKEVFVFGMT